MGAWGVALQQQLFTDSPCQPMPTQEMEVLGQIDIDSHRSAKDERWSAIKREADPPCVTSHEYYLNANVGEVMVAAVVPNTVVTSGFNPPWQWFHLTLNQRLWLRGMLVILSCSSRCTFSFPKNQKANRSPVSHRVPCQQQNPTFLTMDL